jgi:hypothetical protein
MNQSNTPEFDGECAFAVSLGKRQVEGSPEQALVEGDKTYYFKNGAARFLWKLLPNRAPKADAAWTSG